MLFTMKIFSIILLMLFAPALWAQRQLPADTAFIRENYTKREVMIPMRDGKQLFTAIYSPKDQTRKYPVIMRRTPYSCSPYGAGS